MKYSHYILRGDGAGEELAFFQVAALFGLQEKPAQWDGDFSRLPGDAILFYHHLTHAGGDAVSLCEAFFFDAGHLRYAARREARAQCAGLRQDRWLIRLNLFYLLCELAGGNPNPWGVLSGVRPTKLVHRMLDDNMRPEDVSASLRREYALQPEKAKLVTEVALRQRLFLLNQPKNQISVYIGIPFCPTRCLYCSFPAYVLPDQDTMRAFLATLYTDMAAAAELVSRFSLSIQSVYIGGGTPTSLTADDLDRLLAKTVTLFAGQADELTVEAGRPDSLDDDKIGMLASYGVKRVSVNPQTMQQKTLKLIGRMHTVQDIINIFGKIRMCNIPVVNMDLIAGLPGETADDVADTLRQIALLRPDNLTVHTLALKRGSRLSESSADFCLPDAVQTAGMLRQASEMAQQLGMAPYYLYRQKKMAGNLENVGYSLPGSECLYNIQIIEERQTIIGIGPASTTKIRRPGGLTNFYQPKDIITYIKTLPDRLKQREQLLTAALSQ